MVDTKIYAGASGFAYKPWKGPFYPADLPDAEMLPYYAERLPTVEINNTFYRMPKAAMLEGWAAKTPAAFRFVLKASRRITHQQRLKDCADSVDYLFTAATALGDKLGPILFQLPPYMKKDVGLLAEFLAVLPAGRPVTMEFRHQTWFEDDVYAVLKDHGAALCLADTEDETKTAPIVATAGWGYLCLRRDDYDDAALRQWADTIRAQGLDRGLRLLQARRRRYGPEARRPPAGDDRRLETTRPSSPRRPGPWLASRTGTRA